MHKFVLSADDNVVTLAIAKHPTHTRTVVQNLIGTEAECTLADFSWPTVSADKIGGVSCKIGRAVLVHLSSVFLRLKTGFPVPIPV
jgi:hypothetical protein